MSNLIASNILIEDEERSEHPDRQVQSLSLVARESEKQERTPKASTRSWDLLASQNAVMELSTSQKMASACVGAVITSLLMTPLDVVKTRLQAQSPIKYEEIRICCREIFFDCGNKGSSLPPPRLTPTQGVLACSYVGESQLDALISARKDALAKEAAARFNGTLDGVIKIARNEGITSLWRGLSPTLLMAIPAQGIYFTGYDILREKIHKRFQGHPYEPYTPLVAGAVARTAAATIISPLELFRTRLQSGADGVFAGIQNMVRTEGVVSLWRGIGPTLARDVPFSSLYWFGYEKIKHRVGGFDNHNKSSQLQISFISGAVSGMIAATLTHPFDTAKTRTQVNTAGTSMITLINTIIKQEGYKGLFRGLVPRIAKVAPSCAVAISTFEAGKMFFAARNADR